MNSTDAANQQILQFIKTHPTTVLLVIAWSIVWKLIALWKAGKRNHLTMFIVIGVLNTLGILEIIYLIWLYFADKKNPPEK